MKRCDTKYADDKKKLSHMKDIVKKNLPVVERIDWFDLVMRIVMTVSDQPSIPCLPECTSLTPGMSFESCFFSAQNGILEIGSIGVSPSRV